MWEHARAHLPKGRAGDYNQALMDLGARICLPKKARCTECPIRLDCAASSSDSVSLYPPPKNKKPVPEVRMACLAAVASGRYWFGRRPDTGLWGGLWELPTQEIVKHTTPDGGMLFNVPVQKIGELRHVLTHRIIHMSVFVAKVGENYGPLHYQEFRLLSPDQVHLVGVSRLTEKAVKMAQDWLDMRD